MTTETTHTIDIAEFEAFCRSKPGGGYEGCRPLYCAIAQFLKAKYGVHDLNPDRPASYCVEGIGRIDASNVLVTAAYHEPHTFGALADRLAELGR